MLGVYSGHLGNGGDTVDIYQIGQRQTGSVAALNGYVPSYRVDHINYQNAAPWPTQPDGNGPALIRIHTADYGNDPINWGASNAGGTPGQANLVLDQSSPSVPTNLAAHGVLSPTPEINLTWSASSDPQSYVAYYDIYRNGTAVGTSTTTSYCRHDRLLRHELHLHRDGRQPRRLRQRSVREHRRGLPWITGNFEPSATQIAIYFSEPLATGPATTMANYSVSGMTVSSVALSRNNTEVTLTLSSAMTLNAAHVLHGHHDEPDHGLRRSAAGHAARSPSPTAWPA